ncbi:MAG: 3-hydroxyacyl-CoA dehydrogenase family protein, partial [Bacteroidota bacterium]
SADGTSSALDLLRSITGAELEIVVDRVGLVSARTMAMIINEGMFAMMEGVATPSDIDVAMKLGTNYPEGPLAWADRIGADIILHILDALLDEYREERYRPCVLLRQLVRAGRGVHVVDAA